MRPFSDIVLPPVSKEEMAAIYEKVKTPYKYGAVIKLPGKLTDSPSVFRYEGNWYMYFISIDAGCVGSGYETHLAKSSNLLTWDVVDTLLHRDDVGNWDSRQVAGYSAFMNPTFGGDNSLMSVGGRYYMSYLGGADDGYEPDPLYMGLAFSDSPIGKFTKMPEPILLPNAPDGRIGEEKTLYRSCLFSDEGGVSGYKYLNAYNGKNMDDRERIYLAVSNDGVTWERYGNSAIIDDLKDCPTNRISGDAQIVKIGDIYVMFYFRIIDGEGGYDTFAASRDLKNWTKWDGAPLVSPGDGFDNLHAHKPFIIKVEDIVYHYYCACNTAGERFIALATSKELKK